MHLVFLWQDEGFFSDHLIASTRTVKKVFLARSVPAHDLPHVDSLLCMMGLICSQGKRPTTNH